MKNFIIVLLTSMVLSLPLVSGADIIHCPPCIIDMTASIVKQTPDGKFIGGWEPKKIEVTEGDLVRLRIRSLDATHIMYISGYDIVSDEIQPGKVTEVTFVANKTGLFYYSCHMECGPLHKKMVGQLIVSPKKGGEN